MARIPPWNREETILALHTYMNHGRVRENSVEAINLSTYLRNLTDPHTTSDPIKFRNPDAIAMKLRKFAALDPQKSSGLQKGSQMESDIWKEFSSDQQMLSREAEKIMSEINIPASMHMKAPKIKYPQNAISGNNGTSVTIKERFGPIYRSARKHSLKVTIGSALGLMSTAAAILFIKNKK